MEHSRTIRTKELQDVLAAMTSILRLLDEQWDRLDAHQQRSAIKLSLDTARSYVPQPEPETE